MAVFNFVGSLVDNGANELNGVSDVELVSLSGTWHLAVAAEADSAISIFSVTTGGAYTLTDSQSFSATSGTRAVSDLGMFVYAGQTYLAPTTRYENQTALFSVLAGGSLGSPTNATDAALVSEGLGLTQTVTAGGQTYLFAQSYGGSELAGYSVSSGPDLIRITDVADTGAVYLADISAMTAVALGGKQFLYVASAYDAGISGFEVAANGSLSVVEAVAPGDGTGFSLLSDLVEVTHGSTRFVIAASAGTNGLISYQVAQDGTLSEVDTELDTLDTRFQDASTLEVFYHEGRSFVLVAGSDDGITLLEVLSDGSFHVHASLADTYTITLDNVSSISVEVISGVPTVFVGSSTDHGFSQFTLDIPAAPEDPPEPGQSEFVFGTCYADTTGGDAADNRIYGFGGTDILSDGAGQDTLFGGGGQDTFVLEMDGSTDVIGDFRIASEHIDFSNYSTVTQFSDLNISDAGDQVVVSAGSEVLLLDTGGGLWSADDLTADQFLF